MNRHSPAALMIAIAGLAAVNATTFAKAPEDASPTTAAAPATPPTTVGEGTRVFDLKSAAGRLVIVHGLPDLSSAGSKHAIEQHRQLGATLAGVTTVFAVALPSDRFTSELAAVLDGVELPIYRDEGGAFADNLGVKPGTHGVVVVGPSGTRLFGVPADSAGHVEFTAVAKRIGEVTRDRETTHANVADGLALQGYDAVEYLDGRRAVAGKVGVESSYRGIRYRFASAENRTNFNAAPEKYLPAYGGWCATAVAKGDKVEVDPTNFKVTNGRVFLFYKGFWGDALVDWNKDESNLLPKADSKWKTIVSKK